MKNQTNQIFFNKANKKVKFWAAIILVMKSKITELRKVLNAWLKIKIDEESYSLKKFINRGYHLSMKGGNGVGVSSVIEGKLLEFWLVIFNSFWVEAKNI